MNNKSNTSFPIGFTAVDNRIFYMQELMTPNAFGVFIRIYRMSNGYDSQPKSLSNTYFQNYCGISKNTVTRVVKELETLGVVNTVKRSRSNTLYSINLEKVNSLYLVAINNESQNSDEVGTNNGTTDSQELGSTKQNLLKQNNTKENTLNISFEEFWNKYDYKKGKLSIAENKWKSLTDEERISTMQSLDTYKQSTPDKTFRKHPITYLENECWNDEVVLPSADMYSNTSANKHSASFKPFESVSDADVPENNSGSTEAHTDVPSNTNIHWSDLKALGLLKPKKNVDAVAVDSETSKDIDNFLARRSIGRK